MFRPRQGAGPAQPSTSTEDSKHDEKGREIPPPSLPEAKLPPSPTAAAAAAAGPAGPGPSEVTSEFVQKLMEDMAEFRVNIDEDEVPPPPPPLSKEEEEKAIKAAIEAEKEEAVKIALASAEAAAARAASLPPAAIPFKQPPPVKSPVHQRFQQISEDLHKKVEQCEHAFHGLPLLIQRREQLQREQIDIPQTPAKLERELLENIKKLQREKTLIEARYAKELKTSIENVDRSLHGDQPSNEQRAGIIQSVSKHVNTKMEAEFKAIDSQIEQFQQQIPRLLQAENENIKQLKKRNAEQLAEVDRAISTNEAVLQAAGFNRPLFEKYGIRKYLVKDMTGKDTEVYVTDEQSKYLKTPYPLIEEDALVLVESMIASAKKLFAQAGINEDGRLDEILRVFKNFTDALLGALIQNKNDWDIQRKMLDEHIRMVINDIGKLYRDLLPAKDIPRTEKDEEKLFKAFYTNLFHEIENLTEKDVPFKAHNIFSMNKHPRVRSFQFLERGSRDPRNPKPYRSAHDRGEPGVSNLIRTASGALPEHPSQSPVVQMTGVTHASLPPIGKYQVAQNGILPTIDFDDAEADDAVDRIKLLASEHFACIDVTRANIASLTGEIFQGFQEAKGEEKPTDKTWMYVGLLTVSGDEHQDRQYRETVLAADLQRSDNFHPIVFDFGVNWFATGKVYGMYPDDQKFENQRAALQLHTFFLSEMKRINEKNPEQRIGYVIQQLEKVDKAIEKRKQDFEYTLNLHLKNYQDAFKAYTEDLKKPKEERVEKDSRQLLEKLIAMENILIQHKKNVAGELNAMFQEYQNKLREIFETPLLNAQGRPIPSTSLKDLLKEIRVDLRGERVQIQDRYFAINDFVNVMALFMNNKWQDPDYAFQMQVNLLELVNCMQRLKSEFPTPVPSQIEATSGCKSANDRNHAKNHHQEVRRIQRYDNPEFGRMPAAQMTAKAKKQAEMRVAADQRCLYAGSANIQYQRIDTSGGDPKFGVKQKGTRAPGHPDYDFADLQGKTAKWAIHKMEKSILKEGLVPQKYSLVKRKPITTTARQEIGSLERHYEEKIKAPLAAIKEQDKAGLKGTIARIEQGEREEILKQGVNLVLRKFALANSKIPEAKADQQLLNAKVANFVRLNAANIASGVTIELRDEKALPDDPKQRDQLWRKHVIDAIVTKLTSNDVPRRIGVFVAATPEQIKKFAGEMLDEEHTRGMKLAQERALDFQKKWNPIEDFFNKEVYPNIHNVHTPEDRALFTTITLRKFMTMMHEMPVGERTNGIMNTIAPLLFDFLKSIHPPEPVVVERASVDLKAIQPPSSTATASATAAASQPPTRGASMVEEKFVMKGQSQAADPSSSPSLNAAAPQLDRKGEDLSLSSQLRTLSQARVAPERKLDVSVITYRQWRDTYDASHRQHYSKLGGLIGGKTDQSHEFFEVDRLYKIYYDNKDRGSLMDRYTRADHVISAIKAWQNKNGEKDKRAPIMESLKTHMTNELRYLALVISREITIGQHPTDILQRVTTQKDQPTRFFANAQAAQPAQPAAQSRRP